MGIIHGAKVPSCLSSVLACQSGEKCVPCYMASVIQQKEADEAGLIPVETSDTFKAPCVC